METRPNSQSSPMCLSSSLNFKKGIEGTYPGCSDETSFRSTTQITSKWSVKAFLIIQEE